MKKNCIIIFIKLPEAGMVKTRLGKSIGLEVAAKLYECFVKDLLESLDSSKYDVKILYGYGNVKTLKSIFGYYDYLQQEGSDIGYRMYNAFNLLKNKYENLILIGSDIPEIDNSVILSAFNALDKNEAVIGPTFDGGYYLIGFKSEFIKKSIFTKKIIWSSTSVLSSTIKNFNDENIKYSLLLTLSDIDTVDDLINYYQKNKNLENRTINFIKNTNIR